MSERKQFFIATKKIERITLRRKPAKNNFKAFCQTCGKQVEWLTLAEVAVLTGKTADEIKRKIEDGEFDFQITGDNRFIVCAESVFSQSEG